MSRCSRPGGHSAIAAVLILTLAATSGCTSTQRFAAAPGEQAEASPPSPPPPPAPQQPPPVDLGGRWRLSMAAAGGCVMTFTDARGAAEGTIAPAGGCPANFFTSRKWTFERDRLIIRDHKGEPLAELSYAAGRFQGNVTGGGSVDLARL
jgi:Protease inhibitor Inh